MAFLVWIEAFRSTWAVGPDAWRRGRRRGARCARDMHSGRHRPRRAGIDLSISGGGLHRVVVPLDDWRRRTGAIERLAVPRQCRAWRRRDRSRRLARARPRLDGYRQRPVQMRSDGGTAAIRRSASRSAASPGVTPSASAVRSTASVASWIRRLGLRPLEREPVQLVGDLDHAAGVDEVVGAVDDAPLVQRLSTRSWASWLLAPPHTIAARSASAASSSRTPPSAHGA